jgi:hypothetical protein
MATVECSSHGTQPCALVCQHVLQGLIDKQRVGFFWTAEDPTNSWPDAWCRACEDRARATGGEWEGEALANLEPKTICAACYEAAKSFHMGGDPWS